MRRCISARKRRFRMLAAVDAGRAEKHHGVLDVLCPEPAQRFEIFGEDSERTGFLAVEKFTIEIRERLHSAIIKAQCSSLQHGHARIRTQPRDQSARLPPSWTRFSMPRPWRCGGRSRGRCASRGRSVGYAVEWDPTDWRDDLLGPLGGTFHGTVMEFRPGHEFFVADVYWLPPEGDPIGPMALEATCQSAGRPRTAPAASVGLRRNSPRWSRYYDIVSANWVPALEALKKYLEDRWAVRGSGSFWRTLRAAVRGVSSSNDLRPRHVAP